METLLFWLLAMYGLANVWVQCKKIWQLPLASSSSHYYVYTQHSQRSIEWVIRSISEWSRIEGKEMTIYLVDNGSNDDTLMIIDRLGKDGIKIERLAHLPQEIDYLQSKEQHNVIDLREGTYTCGLRTTN